MKNKHAQIAALAVLVSMLAVATSHAATLTVTDINDSGPGSLRECIEVANANPGPDLIQFNIPGASVHTITLLSALPDITTPTVIDGYTQPGSSPNTVVNGNNAVLLIEINGGNFGGLRFTADATNSAVRGLVINRFAAGPGIDFNFGTATASSNVVEGCFIGTDPTGAIARGNVVGVRTSRSIGSRIGGTTPAARNVISGNNGNGLQIDLTSIDNVVQGNFIGTDATGANALANSGDAIFINNGANNCLIGGTNVAARNVIAGNGNFFGIGVFNSSGDVIQGNFIGTDVTGTKAMSFATPISTINVFSCLIGGLTPTPGRPPGNVIAGGVNGALNLGGSGYVIQGNLIGTDASGTLALGSGNRGVTLQGANNCTIGGTNPGAANVISGHALSGVLIANGSANVIRGNWIGTDITGANPLGNAVHGIELQDRENSLIGNTIAFNAHDGVLVGASSASNNRITANSIFANGSTANDLGIDLGIDGVTANDAGDVDTGPNRLQNFPVLTNVIVSLAGITFEGFLASAPNTTYAVEFFANYVRERTGLSQGQTFIGSTNLTTDGSGAKFFSVTLPADVTCRFLATATATDPDGNTSEFSASRSSTSIDTDGDGACDVEEVLAGTDVNDANSVFRITAITREGDDIRVTWQAGGARTNMLQTIPRLAASANAFTDLPPQVMFPVAGDVFTNRLHIGAATNRAGFYRVRLVR